MKTTFVLTVAQDGARRFLMGIVCALALAFLYQDAMAQDGPPPTQGDGPPPTQGDGPPPTQGATVISPVGLGTTTNFAVLAGSGITVAGAVNSTTITGDIGTFPTTSITGLENVVLHGTNYAGGTVTQNAKTDLVTAYNDAAGRSATATFSPIFDLGGLTLTNGVYYDSSSFGLTGTLTLDGGGNPNAVWIFQAGSTLTTASSSLVLLTNGAQAYNVFWQIGDSATLGTSSKFVGTILALNSITMTTSATMDGRALAQNGAVTMDNNTIGTIFSVPEPGSALLLLSSGLAIVFAFRRRFFSRMNSSRHDEVNTP